jgi:hypothetical protein
MYAELERICKRCGIKRNNTMFYKRLEKEARCKPCVSELRKAKYQENSNKIIARVTRYRTENPEKIRETKLKQAYGVDMAWYNAKHKEQNNSCAICKEPETFIWRGKVPRLAVDHDHLTGEARGLLCKACNTSLGAIKEKIETALNMVEYIKKFKK